jgi:uncharacterized protein (TIGR02145 family)
MKTQLTHVRADIIRPLLAATIGLAITFTLSCSGDKDDDNPVPTPAISSSSGSSSSSGGSSSSGLSSSGSGGKGNDIANYSTVQIGDQKWMAENLNYNVASSKCYGEGGQVAVGYDEEKGVPITTTLSNAEVQANCDKYGRLYDWATAMKLPSNCNSTSCVSQIQPKHRGICPENWHIPSSADWDALLKFVDGEKDGKGGDGSCGTGTCYGSNTAGKYLKATIGWDGGGNGTDDYGFSALPGGNAQVKVGFLGFLNAGTRSIWWSTSEGNSGSAYYRGMGSDFGYDDGNKSYLFSVRCVQD